MRRRAGFVIIAQVLKGSGKAFLREVECFLSIARVCADQAINPFLMPPHDLSEGRLAAAKCQCGEFAVRTGRKIDAHRVSAVSAFTTARSNSLAWSGRKICRIAKT